MEGFNKLVEEAWNEAPVDESNAMSNMMKKLKYLKQKIRRWNKRQDEVQKSGWFYAVDFSWNEVEGLSRRSMRRWESGESSERVSFPYVWMGHVLKSMF
ncbi:hypothetical protein Tco_0228473 [Tanacetum coccineum]